MAAMLTLATTALAEVKVAEAFSSHMVLQREKPVSVWGVADAGEKVKVSSINYNDKIYNKGGKENTYIRPEIGLKKMKAKKSKLTKPAQ